MEKAEITRRRGSRLSPARLAAAGLVVLGLLAPVGVSLLLHRGKTVRGEEGHWDEVARGKRLLRMGRPEAALMAVANVRDERPGAAEAMYVAGMALAQLEQFGSARHALERSLTLKPQSSRTLKALAALYLSLGDSARGLECLKRAVSADPDDFRPWFAMGKVYLDLGQADEASSAYDEALRRAPGHIEAQIGRLQALLAANRAQEAGALAVALVASQPESPSVLGLAASQASETGQVDRALELAARALKLNSDEPEAMFVRARLLRRAGKPAEALADLERLVAINPNKLAVLTLKAQVESSLGMADRAAATAQQHRKASTRVIQMDALSKQISARPDDPEPRYQLGLVALEGGQLPLARSCFIAALAVRPDFQSAKDKLSRLNAHSPPVAEKDTTTED
jgi:tetratricopeptide (TPR) repeat protein